MTYENEFYVHHVYFPLLSLAKIRLRYHQDGASALLLALAVGIDRLHMESLHHSSLLRLASKISCKAKLDADSPTFCLARSVLGPSPILQLGRNVMKL